MRLCRLQLLLLLVLLVARSTKAQGTAINTREQDKDFDPEEEDDDDVGYLHRLVSATPPKLTEHQKIQTRTQVDFTGVDFSSNASSAAAQAVEALYADFLENGRLEELFEKATTPECRALIAEHFGYHLKALAKEEPLPFVSAHFNSTCKDEQPWDFNNLQASCHFVVECGGQFKLIPVGIPDYTKSDVSTCSK
mmetsp:Transcript_5128/g.9562  ORF Transcript_5128/g.9562 Transcript_5128/m.9562 type:complete len:194 (+) Transcript_5128:430-1011(+)